MNKTNYHVSTLKLNRTYAHGIKVHYDIISKYKINKRFVRLLLFELILVRYFPVAEVDNILQNDSDGVTD